MYDRGVFYCCFLSLDNVSNVLVPLGGGTGRGIYEPLLPFSECEFVISKYESVISD